MLSGEGNEKGEKTTIGLISKKVTLHVQHTFFVHFFAVVLHDYNVKLPETSWLHVYGGNVVRVLVHFFFSFSLLQNFMLFLQQKMSPLFFHQASKTA